MATRNLGAERTSSHNRSTGKTSRIYFVLCLLSAARQVKLPSSFRCIMKNLPAACHAVQLLIFFELLHDRHWNGMADIMTGLASPTTALLLLRPHLRSQEDLEMSCTPPSLLAKVQDFLAMNLPLCRWSIVRPSLRLYFSCRTPHRDKMCKYAASHYPRKILFTAEP